MFIFLQLIATFRHLPKTTLHCFWELLYLPFRLDINLRNKISYEYLIYLYAPSFQSDVDYSLLLGDNEKDGKQSSLSDSTSNESDALLGRLIRRLTIVIVHHVPIFWRLALSIFSGKFGTVKPLIFVI